jgi:pimeloyl-ACP methyl ester carboxylesterase
MKTRLRRPLRLLSLVFVAVGLLAVSPVAASGAPAQTNQCSPPATTNYGNTGPYAVTTQSDSVHTIYSPSNLGSLGCARHPIIIWGNGTFTQPSWYDGLLRHLASHGFIVAAANTSNAGSGQEMLQGLTTLTQWNGQSGNRFYQRVDVGNVATTCHSQGGSGAMRAGADSRVDTAFPIEGGFFAGSGLNITKPTLYLAGENDTLKTGIRAAYDAARATIPAAYGELAGAGHLVPLGNGGGFRGASTAWARWRLMGDATAGRQFVGTSCGLCTSNDWAVYEASPLLQTLGGGGDPGPGPGPEPGQCVTAANSAHVSAGRATSFIIFVFARGSGDYLGLTSATTSLRQAGTGTWELVDAC